jgi:hypothetical protein
LPALFSALNLSSTGNQVDSSSSSGVWANQNDDNLRFILTTKIRVHSVDSVLSASNPADWLYSTFDADSASDRYTLVILPSAQSKASIEWHVGSGRVAWSYADRSESTAISAAKLLSSTFLNALSAASPSIPSQAHVRLSLTLLLADSHTLLSTSFASAMRSYLNPLLNRLESASAIVMVDTQVIFDTRLPAPVHNRTIAAANLNGLVGRVPWLRHSLPLSDAMHQDDPAAGDEAIASLSAPPLNLLIYVPPSSEAPLMVKSTNQLSSAFLVPRFGGVVLANDCALGADQCLKSAAGDAVALLRSIFGLGPLVSTSAIDMSEAATASGIADWEVDAILRNLLRARLTSTRSRISSMQALLAASPHIPVEQSVADRLHRATLSSDNADPARVRRTAAAADAAMFDASLLPLLYFPDHYVAIVFASFFLPVAMPVVTAAVKHCKAVRKLRATT